MLFHVTMTHTADDCPGYNLDKMPELIAASDNIDKIAEELNVKVHFYLEGAPEHVSFALLEADSLISVTGFVTQIPFKQDYKVTAVTHLKDLMEFAKKMSAQGE
jgi:hypothetical protein